MLRILALAIALGLTCPAWAAPAVVILVRHAEKATEPATDPPLTAAGKERAAELARVMVAWTAAGGKIRALFATELKRTQETLAPLAAAAHVVVTVVNAKETDALVKKVLAVNGGIVVISGHSNTLPEIIEALGGPEVSIEDPEHSRMFVMTAVGRAPAQMVEVRYGR